MFTTGENGGLWKLHIVWPPNAQKSAHTYAHAHRKEKNIPKC